MPTKPVTSYSFATNTLYSVGPFTGDPTKVVPGDLANGLVPGDGIPAGWLNYLFAIAGDWSGWLLAGTYDPDQDAHLVETDSDGFASFAQVTIGGTSASLQALIVTQNTGAQSAAGLFSNTGTGFAIAATAVGSSAAVRGLNTGTGAGVEGVALGTNNVGVKGTGQGTASGGEFTGGATGPGVTCTGGASGDYGALCTGTGAFAGVSGIGGSTAAEAVLGTASWNEQFGVRGVSHASGLTTGGGVIGVGQGDAPGVRSTATSGYGIIAQSDSTSPTRSAFRIAPQDDDPGTAAMGDMTHRSDVDIGRVYTDSRWQSPWTTESGHAHGLSAPTSGNVSNGDSTTYVTITSVSVASPYEPRFAGGELLISAACRFGDADTLNHHYLIDVQIFDVTAAAVVYADTIPTGPANTDPTANGLALSQFYIEVPYTVPAAGARSFQLRFKPNDPGIPAAALANFGCLNAIGVFG